MRSSVICLIAAAILSAGFAPVPPPKARKVKVDELSLKGLEGAWTVVSYEVGQPKANGRVAVLIRPAAAPTYQTVEIKDGKWTQKRTLPNGRTSQTMGYPIKLDAKKSPATFDLSSPQPAQVNIRGAVNVRSTTRLGVARLDGDMLTVTYSAAGQERPARVDGELDTRQYRWVLKRAPR